MIETVFAVALGLVVGSFLNVVADRIPHGGSLIEPPSQCPHCHRRLTALELVPVLSWLALRGRCRTCGMAIPIRAPVLELVTGLAFGMAVWTHGLTGRAALLSVYLALLTLMAVIDLEHHRIPNAIVFPAIMIAAAAVPFTPGERPLELIMGGFLAFGALFLISLMAPRGMGMGDVKLACFVGLIVGFPETVPILLLAFISGGLLSVILLASRRRGWKDSVPFGPFLATSAAIGLFAGEPLVSLWIGGGV